MTTTINPLMNGQLLVEDLRELADFLEQHPEIACHIAGEVDDNGVAKSSSDQTVRVLGAIWGGVDRLAEMCDGFPTEATDDEESRYVGQRWNAAHRLVSLELFTNPSWVGAR